MKRGMQYARCPKLWESVARPSTFVSLLGGVSDVMNQVHDVTVLKRFYDILPLLNNLGRCKRNSDVERRMRTVRRPVFMTWPNWHNVEMYAFLPSDCSPLRVSVY